MEGPQSRRLLAFQPPGPTSLLVEAEIEGRVESHSADPWVPLGRFSPNRNPTWPPLSYTGTASSIWRNGKDTAKGPA